MTLKFSTLNIQNHRRAERWHPLGLEEWSVNDWLCAMAGEAGEACNAGKKHRRLLSKIQQHGDTPADLDAAADRIMEELADTVIYADLVATRLGRRLSDAIIRKFNATSEREGFPERLTDSPSPGKSWTAWMVERAMPSGGLAYLGMFAGGPQWRNDPLIGLHFVRREDAMQFATAWVGDDDEEVRIRQHEFTVPSTQPPAPSTQPPAPSTD